MKHKAPQRDLALGCEDFALVTERTIDGERVSAGVRQSEADRAEAARHQLSLPANQNKEPTNENQCPNLF